MPAKKRISWTLRCEDGVKRETRVEVSRGDIKWQFKRADEERWDYDSRPRPEDWDMLEQILERRAGRGRGMTTKELVARFRRDAGA